MKTKNNLITGLFTIALVVVATVTQAQTYSLGTTVVDVFAG